MKLHGFPPSPNTRKVIAVAHHLGLPLQIVPVDLTQGQQKAPAFLRLNPNGRTPTLEDGDFVLWESNAILEYLADKAPGQLMPVDVQGSALVRQWLCWDLAHWGTACTLLIFERLIKGLFGAGQPDPARIAEGEEKFHQAARVLDACLAGQDYVVRNTLSVADFALAAPLQMAPLAALPIGDYAQITRWYAGIERLDAWKRSAPPPIALP